MLIFFWDFSFVGREALVVFFLEDGALVTATSAQCMGEGEIWFAYGV